MASHEELDQFEETRIFEPKKPTATNEAPATVELGNWVRKRSRFVDLLMAQEEFIRRGIENLSIDDVVGGFVASEEVSYVIGREVTIDDIPLLGGEYVKRGVSRRHAQIECRIQDLEGLLFEFIIKDLRSTNGTFLLKEGATNKKNVAEYPEGLPISNGDVLHLGGISFGVRVEILGDGQAFFWLQKRSEGGNE